MPSPEMPPRSRLAGLLRRGIPVALALLNACAADIGDGTPGGSGTSMGSGGSGSNSGTGNSPTTGTGSTNTTTTGMPSTGTGSTGTGGSAGVAVGTNKDPIEIPTTCQDKMVRPGRAPLRRVTRFEYNNIMADLLGDTSQPATAFPSEELGNGFGNDADALSVSSLLAEQYGTVAENIATKNLQSILSKYAPCANSATTTTTQDSCAKTFIQNFVPLAYRRALQATESDELLALEKAATAGANFSTGISTIVQAVLQAPDFLYRLEFGAADSAKPGLLRPTNDEMATRLSFLFLGSVPDDGLRAASKAGMLTTAEGVKAQAVRLLGDNRSHGVVRFFFDNLLPINGLTDLERDAAMFPTFTKTIGSLMRQETQTFLENEIFTAGGSWPSVLTAPYTFVNGPLAKYYGISGVTGDAFKKVDLDTTKRMGLLLQGGVMTGSITTNQSNPVLRGSFVLNKLMCANLNLPTDPTILAQVKIPEGVTGKTARERFSLHSKQAICSGCHKLLDPVGFSLENYDPVGLYRTQENGVDIDASGSLMGTDGTVNGPVELAQKLAGSMAAQTCFAGHWLDFAYGRTLDDTDECTTANVQSAFQKSGYKVQDLLVNLTQTDAFLYLPAATK